MVIFVSDLIHPCRSTSVLFCYFWCIYICYFVHAAGNCASDIALSQSSCV